MMKHNHLETGIEWCVQVALARKAKRTDYRYWGGGLGAAMIFLGLIDLTHRDMAPWREARIPRVSLIPRCSKLITRTILLIPDPPVRMQHHRRGPPRALPCGHAARQRLSFLRLGRARHVGGVDYPDYRDVAPPRRRQAMGGGRAGRGEYGRGKTCGLAGR
jgi:hypothetical protein